MRLGFRTGYLFEEIGLVFKKAPIPRGMSKEDIQVYKDVLEEKYLEALDAALPKYEQAIYAAKELGIVQNAWLDSIKARVSYINPSSKALAIQITERPPRTAAEVASATGSSPGGSSGQTAPTPSVISSAGGDNVLAQALQRINNIVAMNIAASEKIAQLRSIENEANREITSEEETIEDYKEKLGIK